MDFLASGVPFATNDNSSSVEHLRRMYDFRIASITEIEQWLSPEYWSAVQSLGARLRQSLSLDQVAARFLAIVAPLLDGDENREARQRNDSIFESRAR